MFSGFYYRLLVGAPAADSQQPNVYRGGAVYKCHPDSPGRCEMIPFDREGKNSKTSLFILLEVCHGIKSCSFKVS